MELEVVAKGAVAAGVVQFELQHSDRVSLPQWAPGAHVALVLPMGERQYSLCGDLTDRATYRIAVLRELEGRGGSRYLTDEVQQGDVVQVREPLNHFALQKSERYLFIAGGIGITPVLAMMREARRVGAAFKVAYGGRSLESMAYVDDVLALDPDAVIWPEEQRGLLPLSTLLAEHPDDPVYCCGPEGLLAAIEGGCAAAGRPAPHLERFAVPERVSDEEDRPFTLVLARSGLTCVVPADRSALDVLTDAGADIFGSCLEGTCGSCEVGVLAGEPDHRDIVLTKEMQHANDCMMPCVSRARTDSLTIDL